MTKDEAIQEYQCPGCSNGPYPECLQKCDTGIGCNAHNAGTIMPSFGRLFLGMPKGFMRLGSANEMPLHIFNSFDEFCKEWTTPAVHGPSDGYNIFNVPTWKYLDKLGNTIVRGHSPRTNSTFLHVILGNCRDKINCLEITQEIQDKLD